VAAGSAIACLCLTSCGGSSASTPAALTATTSSAGTSTVLRTVAPTSAQTTATVSRTTVRPPPRRRPKGPDPGSLPQTSQLPSVHTAAFRAEVDALWRGIRTGSRAAAMPAFFPMGAYEQLKTLADVHADYVDRLVGDYGLDVTAAHALLGAQAPAAQLVDVLVPSSYAHWVPAGVCDNQVGYYEVPNARLVYRKDGEIHSLGIASMISWRGVWYVVHLGAVVRSAAVGVVDDPSTGAGFSVPSSTC
jgi:hypothetical protein